MSCSGGPHIIQNCPKQKGRWYLWRKAEHYVRMCRNTRNGVESASTPTVAYHNNSNSGRGGDQWAF
ncbi:Hypothetical protein FKW44_008367 [Caligus rogercresseyi]|uniref:Uncharacterized protein n=1 Tax=Caligus rogercresseyi TaxID=217165 RepID=A0A7T8KG05_CALRO|nr:Hypothetical protein FKW44_008367 [Caligus rogercresseyi]